MHELTQLIKDDMRPALGVTEPGAIAYAVSKAKSYVPGELEQVTLLLNSGMYKNAYTCGIPNSHFYGNEYAAALGVVAGKPEKELESLADVTEADNVAAEQLVKDGKIAVKMSEITSRIFIEACVKTTGGEAMVQIRDAHTNIVRIEARKSFSKSKGFCADDYSTCIKLDSRNRRKSIDIRGKRIFIWDKANTFI